MFSSIQKILVVICIINFIVNYVVGPIFPLLFNSSIASSIVSFVMVMICGYIAFKSAAAQGAFKATYLRLINRIRYAFPSRTDLAHWQNPEIVAINTIKHHAPLRLLGNKDDGLLAVETKRGEHKWNIFLANSDAPTRCEFRLYANPFSVDLNNTEWSSISLPSNWQIQFPEKDPPTYTNITYPFKRKFLSTNVPRDDNPTGLYRLPFRISKEWFDLIENGTRELFLIFHGAGSGIDIMVNGKRIGYGQDSMTETEVNITSADLRSDADNIIHCIVYRWTDGSYLEDQDQWWLSGIFRDVELQCRLKEGGLQDYVVKSGANGLLTFEGILTNNTKSNVDIAIELELYDKSKQLVQRIKSNRISDIRMQIDNCHLWNVQDPYLYTLLVAVYHNAELVQVEATRVGFRTVEIKNSQLFVNDEAVLICGVNRHEFDPKLGKVMQEVMMVKDIELMKQFNFNAVRSCHYPNVQRWYELCDEYGLFVVDEANIETHGFAKEAHLSLLQHDDHWKQAFLSRCQAMVFRVRNRPSVIGWSLGNESGCGPNMRHCAKWIRSMDPTRTLQYEGGIRSGDSPLIMGEGRDPYCSDIICPMYDSPLRCAQVIEETKHNPEARPFILCEYAHAMGNSSGNLHLYWNLFRSKAHPRLQGGFIWDWVDQGLYLDGSSRFGYGGDFGAKSGKEDTTFCINGMCFPDRVPHPAMYEAKYLMQPITFKQIESAYDRIEMEVFSHCPSIDCLQFHWFLHDYKSSKPIDGGKCRVVSSNNRYQLILSGRTNDAPYDTAATFLRIEASFNKDMRFANKNHTVATQIFQKNFQRLLIDENENENVEFTKKDNGNILIISSHHKYVAEFDVNTGCLISFTDKKDEGALLFDLKHSFFRAPTDNDLGGTDSMLHSLITGDQVSINAQWQKIGLDELKSSTTTMKIDEENKAMIVKQQHKHKNDVRFTSCTTFCFQNDGIKLDVNIEADDSTLRGASSLPRIGMEFLLPPEFEHVKYLGCGPHESYPDRKASSVLGVHDTTVSAMHIPYVLPTENGGRSDVQWVQFQSNKNKNKIIQIQYSFPKNDEVGIEFFDGDDLSQQEPLPTKRASDMKGAQLSASRYSVNDLSQAKHQWELPDIDVNESPVYVHIDTAHQGVGGDRSWSPSVHDQYKVHNKSWKYAMIFKIL